MIALAAVSLALSGGMVGAVPPPPPASPSARSEGNSRTKSTAAIFEVDPFVTETHTSAYGGDDFSFTRAYTEVTGDEAEALSLSQSDACECQSVLLVLFVLDFGIGALKVYGV